MKALTLVRRGLRFHRRTHLGVIAGCAVSAAVLVGALFVGDSVRETLRELALARLGRIHHALDSGDRYFRDGLAARVRAGLGTEVGSALRVDGMALREKIQVNRVEVLGVDAGFLGRPVAPGRVALGAKLAAALGAKAGDEVALRIFKPGLLSREAPLASGSKGRETQRELVTVERVLSDAELGRFSLRSDQAAPHNAFVDLAWLQERLELEGRANLIVTGASTAEPGAWLKGAWRIEDAGLSLRAPEGTGVLQLQSDRIYLDPAVASAALALRPDASGVLYYLVNSLASESGRSTPYSFLAAGPVPAGMKDDEILVNRWLADQIGVGEGGRVEVAYSESAAGGGFVEKRRAFRVRGVLPMEALALEKALVPPFPGLTDVESCKNWDLGGISMDEKKLADEANEKYWKEHRATPKAIVTLAAGRQMWANRYGDLMAVRYPASGVKSEELAETLRLRIDPAGLGLGFRPVREQALRAASESMDLGQLFLGMSFFLIIASLMLTAMLFVFSVEQRAREMGVLRAVGYSPGRVRSLFLLEGTVLAALGSLAGVPVGWAFAKALVWGLGGAWSGAVAEAAIAFHASVGSAAAGVLSATLISLLAMALALWRQARRPVRELVAEDFSSRSEFRNKKDSLFCYGSAWGGLGGAAGVAIWTLLSGAANPAGNFFGAGSLMLVGGIALVRLRLGRLATRSSARLSVTELGVRNAARRPARGTATAAMLACGCFIVFSVSAMKEDFSRQSGERRSGTGGFALYGESSIPIRHDLNDAKGRAAFFLSDALMAGVSILPLRLREGDDASCLNLNQSLTPPLLGVDAERLSKLGAFADPDLWARLDRELPDGAVPALVGDASTAMWKLKKKAGPEDGDLLDYKDERGRDFKVKLVGALPQRLTVLQGRLLISARHFTRMYPSEGGSRVFLVDVPAGQEARVKAGLTEKLETAGLDWVAPVERLKDYYAVESAYLRMFFVLGGLGLLLGSAGMGVLVLRHVMERRGELALLRAVGYSETEAARVVTAEHRWLLAAGLATGCAAAALAVGPGALQPSVQVPWGLLAAFLAGTAVLSLTWIRVATRLALRAPLVPALRNE